MAFTAKDVAALREKTGVGMMDCKKALVEADGDFELALNNLRERGLAAAVKKAERITSEGVVLAYQEGDVSVLLEVNSETDFVGKNPGFQEFVLDIAKTIAAQNPADVEALSALPLAGGARTVEESRQDKILSCGENLSIRRFTRLAGNPAVASYVHGGGAMGVLAEFKTEDAGSAAFKEMSRNVAMQVAAMQPLYLDIAGVPAEDLEAKRQEFLEQIAEDPKMANKPEKILAGIVQGKIGKFYKEACLLEQAYVKDDETTVGKYIQSVAKELDTPIEAIGFVRYAKGENMQKREDDFAAEVAAATKGKA